MTTSTATPAAPSLRRRTILFRVLTAVSLALFAFAIPNALTPWVHVDFQHDGVIQAWRDGVEGSIDTLMWIAVVGLALKPLARPLIAQLLITGAAVAATVIPAAGPTMAITLVLILLPVVAYPHLGRLRELGCPNLDRPAAAVAVATTAVLLPLAVAAWSANDNQAATYAEHLTMLAAAGLAAATRRPGWRWIAWPTVATWIYLGVIAIEFPHELNSFGPFGGLGCFLTAAAFAAATVRPSTAITQASIQPGSAP